MSKTSTDSSQNVHLSQRRVAMMATDCQGFPSDWARSVRSRSMTKSSWTFTSIDYDFHHSSFIHHSSYPIYLISTTISYSFSLSNRCTAWVFCSSTHSLWAQSSSRAICILSTFLEPALLTTFSFPISDDFPSSIFSGGSTSIYSLISAVLLKCLGFSSYFHGSSLDFHIFLLNPFILH